MSFDIGSGYLWTNNLISLYFLYILLPGGNYTVLLEYFTNIKFYEFVILDILRVFNFTILSVLNSGMNGP